MNDILLSARCQVVLVDAFVIGLSSLMLNTHHQSRGGTDKVQYMGHHQISIVKLGQRHLWMSSYAHSMIYKTFYPCPLYHPCSLLAIQT